MSASELVEVPAARTVIPRSRATIVHLLLLATAVTASVLLVTFTPRHSSMSVAFVVVATVACGAFTVVERRDPRVGIRAVVVAIGIVFAVAVATPPRTSNDLWSYAMYGRIVTVHGDSPYSSVPADFRDDPFVRRVSPIWRTRASVFGPLWVGYAAAGAAVVGDSPLGNRLWFQLTAAAVATAILVVVWRRTRSPVALAWLGLHPVFGAMAVNGGHSDLVVGLAILAAALAVSRGRGGWAGVALGLGALVKITALLGVVGVVFWAWRRGRRRLAGAVVGATAATMLLGYLPFAADASHVMSRADHTVTPGSLWNGIADLILGSDAGRAFLHPLAPNATLHTLFVLGAALVVVLALTLGWHAASTGDARQAAGTAAASYAIAAEYTFPWYATWAMPSLTDHDPTPLAWVVWTQAAVMLMAVKLATHPNGTAGDFLARWPITYLAPVALLVAFVVAGTRTLDAHPGVGRLDRR